MALNYSAVSGIMVSGIATLLILIFSRLAWRRGWLTRVGLRMSAIDLFFSFLLLCALNGVAIPLILAISRSKDICFTSHLSQGLTIWYLSGPFQVLNEEIVLGALLLKGLKRLMQKFRPAVISIMAASLFSFGHFITFTYLFSKKDSLSLLTLFSLLLAGIIRNNAILSTGRIGYSFAIHFSWNLAVFGGRFVSGTTATNLGESRVFNLILGNPLFFVLALVATLLSFWMFRLKRKPTGIAEANRR